MLISVVAGFEGSRCETNKDDCTPNPCLGANQQCMDLVNSYYCHCDDGKRGENCDKGNSVAHEKTYLLICERYKVSNPPAHQRSLIRVFVIYMDKSCILGYPKWVQ